MPREALAVCTGTCLALLALLLGEPLWGPLLAPHSGQAAGAASSSSAAVSHALLPQPLPPGAAAPLVCVVSGAGDASYDGTYVEGGLYGGRPYYAKGRHARYLYWAGVGWVLAGDLGEGSGGYGAKGHDLVSAKWVAGPGSSPAPTVHLQPKG